MANNWIGKNISIKTLPDANSGKENTFQGTIKRVSPEVITIVRAFRNGVPVRKPDTEVKISSDKIAQLELIPETSVPPNLGTGVITTKPTPIKQTNIALASGNGSSSQSVSPPKLMDDSRPMATQANQKYFAQPQSARATDMPNSTNNSYFYNNNNNSYRQGNNNFGGGASGGYNGNANRNNNNNNGGGGGGGGKNSRRYQNSKNETFGTPVNDPMMEEDFDFEKNLALFDKQAIWNKIDQGLTVGNKPDLLHHNQGTRRYRHDENVLHSAPAQYRQIEVDYNSSRDYVTDDGLIVPSIPLIVRNRLQTAAEAMGLTWERQMDVLSRGTADVALQLLGGAQRLRPNNQHQWPKIVVVCDEPYNEKKSEIGICTGRTMATHGIRTTIYVREMTYLSRMSHELDLFKATGNEFTSEISQLPSCDLIIVSARTSILSPDIIKWISESRSPVLAIDPPAHGFVNIQAKCSVLPILPLDNINPNACGKLYLCNLGIPDKFFHDAGFKYSSPFGHKFVIPIHLVD